MNTFWKLIDGHYYRIFNGELKYAPACEYSNSVLLNKEEKVEVINPELLEKINYEFGSTLSVDDIA